MRRRGFGDNNPIDNDDWSNLTKYDEKYILPTDGGSSAAVTQTAPSATGVENVMPPAAEQTVYSVGRGFTQQPTQTATERPMVFALRAYKDVYVYEYSDRLEYYKHTPNGMVKCNTEYKKR